MSLRSVIVALLLRPTFALPNPSKGPKDQDAFLQTLPSTVGWVEAPQVRGTFDLLLSCITTLSLCAWTAYHPNVHVARSEWRRWGHRVIWMLIAVFVPEIVLYCAWDQWWATRKLRDDINSIGEKAFNGSGVDGTDGEQNQCEVCHTSSVPLTGDPESEEGSTGNAVESTPTQSTSSHATRSSDFNTLPTHTVPRTKVERPYPSPSPDNSSILRRLRAKFRKRSSNDPKPPLETPIWTSSVASFALSGGFAVPTSFHPRHTSLTLTPPALIQLARLGLLPNETPESIADKSKADIFAKALVCIQAGWFLLQCIARTAKHLPLSLLEVHVLTHVLCAFAMYILWIDKPYDVGNPVMIRDEQVHDLAALWSLHLEETSNRQSPVGSDDRWNCSTLSLPNLSIAQVRASHAQSNHPTSARRRYWKVIYRYCGLHERESDSSQVNPNQPSNSPSAAQPATPGEEEHLKRATRAIKGLRDRSTHLVYLSQSQPIYPPSSATTSVENRDEEIQINSTFHLSIRYLVPLRSNLLIDGREPDGSISKSTASLSIMMNIYAILSAAYGALHLVAWNARFVTVIEGWLWRASGITMVGAPIGTVIILSWGSFDRALDKWRRNLKGAGIIRDEEEHGESDEANIESKAQKPSVYSRSWRSIARALAAIGDIISSMVFCVVVCLVGFAWAAYPVARIYVLVESFAGLRSVEKDVYRTVEWTGFIPHAG
ncbi:hypothetical protein B0J11DRAFT_515434 [Dendryphion nanum]|uniref:Uncharacterized protein n=1 Tax=Dendryphion nanum TaxID=256645 RepID=A0A9P9EJJ1_9PLEO|nr:hypothetical protein B0J11DRAFT_515434 [Dendryphion nanum]